MRSAILICLFAIVVLANCQDDAAAAPPAKWSLDEVLQNVGSKLNGKCFNLQCRIDCRKNGSPSGYCTPENTCACVVAATAQEEF